MGENGLKSKGEHIMKNLKKIEILLITLFMISIAFTNFSFATPDTNGKMLGLYDGDVGRPSGFYTTATSQSRREIPIMVQIHLQMKQ